MRHTGRPRHIIGRWGESIEVLARIAIDRAQRRPVRLWFNWVWLRVGASSTPEQIVATFHRKCAARCVSGRRAPARSERASPADGRSRRWRPPGSTHRPFVEVWPRRPDLDRLLLDLMTKYWRIALGALYLATGRTVERTKRTRGCTFGYCDAGGVQRGTATATHIGWTLDEDAE